MDVVALAQHGVDNAVATLGTATTPVHVAEAPASSPTTWSSASTATRRDARRPGARSKCRLPVLADGKVVSFLFLPAEDDPDTYVRREGKAAFLAAVADAKPLSQFLFAELAAPRRHGHRRRGVRASSPRRSRCSRRSPPPRFRRDAAPAPGRARRSSHPRRSIGSFRRRPASIARRGAAHAAPARHAHQPARAPAARAAARASGAGGERSRRGAGRGRDRCGCLARGGGVLPAGARTATLGKRVLTSRVRSTILPSWQRCKSPF